MVVGNWVVHLKLSVHISRSSKLNKLAKDDRATDEQPWHTILLQQLCLCLLPNVLSPAFDDLQQNPGTNI